MIVVGIPTLNEEENISSLIKKIDDASQKLNVEIVIINADSNSNDKTRENFLNTKTRCRKYSYVSLVRGKGINIRLILEKARQYDNLQGVVLIDGDVTSFETEWLGEFKRALDDNKDYIIPCYSRNFQEGNTTNHFVYPLLYAHSKGNAPRQPICGDFGMSKKYIDYLLDKVVWHQYTSGYGIDVFLTMHALFNDFSLCEIQLASKNHNPSFDKMVPMFLEVASSYYETLSKGNLNMANINYNVTFCLNNGKLHNPSHAIPRCKISDLTKRASSLLENIDSLYSCNALEIDQEKWADILFDFDMFAGKYDSAEIAKQVLPLFLIRVSNFLRKNISCKSAQNDIEQFAQNLKARFDEQNAS